MYITSTNLITNRLNSYYAPQAHTKNNSAVSNNVSFSGNLISQYLDNVAKLNTPIVNGVNNVEKVSEAQADKKPYKNDLKTLLLTNSANIMAIVPRTFNAKDTNNNEYIDGREQCGTFLNAIDRLDEMKDLGINTLHVLPINTPGKNNAKGTAGSVYAPEDLLELDPMLIDKNDPRSDVEQFKAFVDACHDRNIRVMVDLPSCASFDLYNAKPELMAKERNGMPKTPQGWQDIRMFQPWEDEGKRTLNPELLEYHRKFVDLMIDSGVAFVLFSFESFLSEDSFFSSSSFVIPYSFSS
jgi:hypothetical protein